MTHKKLNGQFFTTNANEILNGFSKHIINKNVVDPFAGNKDLMFWAKRNGAKKIIGFDVDENYTDSSLVFWNDSINSPRKYKFVITNPPYLHKNKATRMIKEKYFNGSNSLFEDLYQVSIKSILDSEEGIVIVPLNFLSAKNSKRIRTMFFNKFHIVSLNVFKEQVFEDTSYNVISFYYKKNTERIEKNIIKTNIFPENKKTKFLLERKYNWQIGGHFCGLISPTKNLLGIHRLTEKHITEGKSESKLAFNNIKDIRTYKISQSAKNMLRNNIIFLRAIDSKNGKKIQLEDIRDYGVDGLIGKSTSRNMAYLLFKQELQIETQKKLILYFNRELEKNRKQYLSLFLTNFRDNNRKRIGFAFAYKLINYIFINKMSNNMRLC